MDFSMAGTAKYDEIFFDITSQGTARLNVMDLEIFGTSTSLAWPAIPSQQLPATVLDLSGIVPVVRHLSGEIIQRDGPNI